MIEVVRDILTNDQCEEIIKIAETRAKWNPVYQGYSVVDVLKVYIKPHIQHILKDVDLEIPENSCVEVLKYRSGSSNGKHIDAEGDHQVSETSFIRAEWKQTGVILLNDNFESGGLYFPEIGRAFGKETKGDLVLFSAGKNSQTYAHGVHEVQNGTRYTLVFRHI
jgi:hypothetical protein